MRDIRIEVSTPETVYPMFERVLEHHLHFEDDVNSQKVGSAIKIGILSEFKSKERKRSKNHLLISAKIDGKEKIIPYLICVLAYKDDHPVGCIVVINRLIQFFVKEECRNGGIGSQMHDALLDQYPGATICYNYTKDLDTIGFLVKRGVLCSVGLIKVDSKICHAFHRQCMTFKLMDELPTPGRPDLLVKKLIDLFSTIDYQRDLSFDELLTLRKEIINSVSRLGPGFDWFKILVWRQYLHWLHRLNLKFSNEFAKHIEKIEVIDDWNVQNVTEVLKRHHCKYGTKQRWFSKYNPFIHYTAINALVSISLSIALMGSPRIRNEFL